MNITILQWNVWYKENPDNIVSQIRQINPDIICAQEFIKDSRKNSDTAGFIAEKLGMNFYYHEAQAWTNRSEKETQGNAIFSCFPISQTSFTYVKPPVVNPPSGEHEGRVYIETSIQVSDSIFTIGTTHLSFSPSFEMTEARRAEADNLADIAAKNKTVPYILAGDLNAPPDSYAVAEIEKQLKNAGPDFSEPTWPTKPFDYHGFKEDKLAWRIDYVFVSPLVTVVNAKILKTSFSDHLPILIEVEI